MKQTCNPLHPSNNEKDFIVHFSLFIVHFFLLLIANTPLLFAQNSDWSLWTSINAEKKLSKNWELGIGTEFRWKDNISATDQIRGSADVSRKMGKYVKLGAGYVFIADKKVKKDIFEYRNRFLLQATGSYEYARFTASWRTRLQLTLLETNEPRGDLFDDDSFKWVWRNRFGLKYNIKGLPLKPYANIELFHHIFSGQDDTPGYYQNRFSAGIEYKLAKQHTFEAGYKLETEVDNVRKYKNNIVKLGYTFSF